jgi:hypothetical protein
MKLIKTAHVSHLGSCRGCITTTCDRRFFRTLILCSNKAQGFRSHKWLYLACMFPFWIYVDELLCTSRVFCENGCPELPEGWDSTDANPLGLLDLPRAKRDREGHEFYSCRKALKKELGFSPRGCDRCLQAAARREYRGVFSCSGCPISRVLCEKWGFFSLSLMSLVAEARKHPSQIDSFAQPCEGAFACASVSLALAPLIGFQFGCDLCLHEEAHNHMHP